jgi:hyperosmotically inducible protein
LTSKQRRGEDSMRAKTAFLTGAGAAYFLDPKTGKRRRHVARDRLLRALRLLRHGAVKKAKLAGGRARGLAAIARRGVRTPAVAVDDETVVQRIRSDALRDVELSTSQIDVRVEDGYARLSGSVATIDDEERLVSRVRKVPGVKEVSAEVRVAEE